MSKERPLWREKGPPTEEEILAKLQAEKALESEALQGKIADRIAFYKAMMDRIEESKKGG